MTVYLCEHELGFDANSIGFPNLGGCMAIVLQTDQGLYGWHMPPTKTAISERTAAFLQFYNTVGPHGNFVHLYGSCYRDNRVTDDVGWKDEMKVIAAALSYQGPVSGYDISRRINKIGTTESTYLEYQRNGRTCEIYYKRMTKMNVTKGSLTPGATVERMKLGSSTYAPDGSVVNVYEIGNVTGTNSVTDIDIVPTPSNEGELHKAYVIGTFNYP
jgi:hypothetical protein